MARVKAIVERIVGGIGVYIGTLIGILLSQYAPLLLTSSRLDSTFDWVRLAISAAVALYIVGTDESAGDPAGKAAHWRRRLGNAFAHGVAWNSIIGIAGVAAGK
jgi:hypothetical protein